MCPLPIRVRPAEGEHSRDDVPQCFCKDRRRYFRRRYKAKAHREPTRRKIRRLTLEGISVRRIAAALEVSPTTVAAYRRSGDAIASVAMTFAYADPPYVGQAARHYRHDPRCAEVDHASLIRHPCDD